jgi:hypothetical protein
MPNPNEAVRNNFSHSDYSPSTYISMPPIPQSLKRDTNSHISSRKSLSSPQLSAIYKEIVDEWYNEKWLTFVDNHTETYLTLDGNTTEFLTTQMAIAGYYLKSGRTSLISEPEILLIRTKSKSKTVFSPNSNISLGNLYENHIGQRLFRYKLLAIICHSNETNSKLMFYKDFRTHSWYIYYDESVTIPAHSNVLSNEEQSQLESIIQVENHLDLSYLIFPLSALCNHPIVYVYIPDKN